MRLMGRMVGRVGKAVVSSPSPPVRQTHEVRRHQETSSHMDETGNTITLRRTTIEEIDITPRREP